MLIIFDLDDTLIDTERLMPFVLKKALKAMILEGLNCSENIAYKKLIKIDKKSKSTKDTINNFLISLKEDKKFFKIAFSGIYNNFFEEIEVFSLKNANKILKYLSKNHTLAIVSKGIKKLQFDKIKKASIDRAFFSKIIITDKDNKGFYYKKIIKELGFSRENTYIVGDKISTDLLPGQKLGCKTIHMRWGRGRNFKTDKKIDYSIKTLNELKKIFKRGENVIK